MSIRIASGRGLLRSAGGALMYQVPGGEEAYDPETRAWIAAATAAGGAFRSDSKQIANDLITAIKAKSFNSKIVYLMPFLGDNLASALVPLRDRLGVGAPANFGLNDGDFRQSRGIQGNGTNKYLVTAIKPADLGAGNCGGLGWWEGRMSFFGHVEPIGCYGADPGSPDRFVLDLRANLESFRWGQVGNGAGLSTQASSAHYYGQRSSATLRELYRKDTLIASQTTADSALLSSAQNIVILGVYSYSFAGGYFIEAWPGRCGCAYLTDGTLTYGEVASLYQVLRTKLMVPTGRVAA